MVQLPLHDEWFPSNVLHLVVDQGQELGVDSVPPAELLAKLQPMHEHGEVPAGIHHMQVHAASALGLGDREHKRNRVVDKVLMIDANKDHR